VVIVHQDGTRASYRHLKPQGVLVSAGAIVHRGTKIGLVGTTGNSAGPHLHTSATVPGGGSTIMVRYEARSPLDDHLISCHEAQSGDSLQSTNVPWP
jgi:peptidase M23-like protein